MLKHGKWEAKELKCVMLFNLQNNPKKRQWAKEPSKMVHKMGLLADG